MPCSFDTWAETALRAWAGVYKADQGAKASRYKLFTSSSLRLLKKPMEDCSMTILELTRSGLGQTQTCNSLHQLRGFTDPIKFFGNSSWFFPVFVFPFACFEVWIKAVLISPSVTNQKGSLQKTEQQSRGNDHSEGMLFAVCQPLSWVPVTDTPPETVLEHDLNQSHSIINDILFTPALLIAQ